MRSICACIAAGALSFAPCAGADSLSSAHFPNPDARFSDALGARDLAIEALLNASPDGNEANAARKRAVPEKAGGTVFGSIRNSFGTPLCGLVLANGQFMFSCSPVGAYSIDTVTDAQGTVTLFGFVDGHFPYKKALNGFGRWDIVIPFTDIIIDPAEPITFSITDACDDAASIDYKFYDVTNNLVWPSASSHYVASAYNVAYSHSLACKSNAKICFGARSGGSYWGIDVDASKSCSDCCIFCIPGNSLSRRLTC